MSDDINENDWQKPEFARAIIVCIACQNVVIGEMKPYGEEWTKSDFLEDPTGKPCFAKMHTEMCLECSIQVWDVVFTEEISQGINSEEKPKLRLLKPTKTEDNKED
jgi:hypothetical protein